MQTQEAGQWIQIGCDAIIRIIREIIPQWISRIELNTLILAWSACTKIFELIKNRIDKDLTTFWKVNLECKKPSDLVIKRIFSFTDVIYDVIYASIWIPKYHNKKFLACGLRKKCCLLFYV